MPIHSLTKEKYQEIILLEKEKTNEPSLIDRISGWFIEDNID